MTTHEAAKLLTSDPAIARFDYTAPESQHDANRAELTKRIKAETEKGFAEIYGADLTARALEAFELATEDKRYVAALAGAKFAGFQPGAVLNKLARALR